MFTCKARQYGDQMICNRCGFNWDTNDPDPPSCKPQEDLRRERGRRELDRLKKAVSHGR